MKLKSKSKQSMVKLDDVLVKTDDYLLSSGQWPLPVYIWETLRMHWQRKKS